jgi:hypothetical protein
MAFSLYVFFYDVLMMMTKKEGDVLIYK